MADDTTLGAAVGVGDKISTDDLGAGTKVQRVKVQFGADGSATDTSSANPLPVVQTGTPGLPTGASTAAKQPALGTAGTPSADVLSVQGVASMTPVKVDGSGVTQPVSGTVTASGPLTDTQLRASAVPVSLATLPALVAGTAAIGKLAANSGVDIGDVDVTSLPSLPAGTNNIGDVDVLTLPAIPAGSNTIGKVDQGAGGASAWKVDGSAVVQPVAVIGSVTAAGSVGLQKPAPSTSYSKQMYAAQTTTVRTVKGTGGVLGGWMVYNPNASVAYVQLFDVASATTVTLGTTVPDAFLVIPAASAANVLDALGIGFTNGIKLAVTTTATGSTAPGAGLDLSVFYA